MDDKAIQTYVLNVAEEFGCRNADTAAKVQAWDKPFMQDLLGKKISRLRETQSKHMAGSNQHDHIEGQIQSIEEVRSAIRTRK